MRIANDRMTSTPQLANIAMYIFVESGTPYVISTNQIIIYCMLILLQKVKVYDNSLTGMIKLSKSIAYAYAYWSKSKQIKLFMFSWLFIFLIFVEFCYRNKHSEGIA